MTHYEDTHLRMREEIERLNAKIERLKKVCDKAITYMTHEEWLEFDKWMKDTE